ncbi:hypothetical protein C7M84_013970 [Penaeus vannamei]|uniref:CUB domain-containing protein n=1 Tax=Penaeus vannamei TaxID=6689 RepID=A0A3R7PIT9_PENVA|nr:hypothetical protein C7M84_013970 [Penaeus vannamei]
MQKEKTFTFVFVLQVRSSGTVTQTFSSMASLIALTGIRQDTPDIRAEVNEEGTDTTTFVSALDRVNKTSTSNNTECLYTMELILQKIQFTNAVTGELYPCDLDNQENAEPPYVEIRDKYNNTHIKRYCYLDRNESIHSFGDQMFGYIVTNGDPNIVPDIRAIQIKEEYCCGGVFYGAFREPLIIPSPDYPQYKPHMRCPFVFRCDEDFEDCVIRLEFESFNLASNDLSRSRRQALNESDFGNGTDATTLAPYVPPTGSDFNRTICAGEDVVRVSQCDSISAINGREFCADNPPSQVYTGYKEVLLYFDSNDERQDQGFVIKFTAKDRRKWIYSDAELNPQCTCAHNLPNQIRKYFRKRNKSKANKAKANNESLRRVRREERENLKERRMAEREGRIPERKRGKMKPQNDGNRDKSDKDKDEKREKDVEGPKSRKMKPQNGGNRDKSDKDKDEKREKDVEGTKSRKMKPQNENKAQRLQRKNKNEDEDMPMSRALNARTNRKRQQFPWLVSVVQYELPLVGDKKTKKRDPFKKDVAAIIGEGRISINKLGDIQPQKIARIFIPSDCYDKMGKTELNGEPLYPVECPVILKLKKKQKFNRFIKPMCLPIFDKIKINKERAASMGYGIRKSTKREPSKIPAEVINMRVLKKCEKRLKMKLDKTMICTKGKKERTHVLLRRRFAALECQSNWRWIQAACQPLRCLGCAKLRT